MLLLVLVCSLSLAVFGQQEDEDWLDPTDMLNYDSNTKTMRRTVETERYTNVPTKRREYTQDSSQAMQTVCDRQVVDLQRQVEEQKKKITQMIQQPTCTPVFKRFLSRLLKEIERVGLPSGSAEVFYDASIRLSKQSVAEIQALLDGQESWRTGALDNALSQILVDLKPHDYEAWKWRFEETFGVELDTLLKTGLFVLVIMAIVCTQLWSPVSWFVQFHRLFAVSFAVSIVWNWFYLYKIAFAEHQNNIAKMHSINEKCTGMKKMEWSDSLKEWLRSTWTLQDDPCKTYYEVLVVNPILLVPPTKAISVTITTFITEPLKHFGQGISEFLRALLKDLPFTLQIPVLLTIVLSIVVCMYGSVQAAFQHGITAPFRRRRGDPALPHQRNFQQIEDRGDFDEAPQQREHRANDARPPRNEVRQRHQSRDMQERGRKNVETLRTAEALYSNDETDIQQNRSAESDSDTQEETQEELAGATASSVAGNPVQSKPENTQSDSHKPNAKSPKENKKPSKDEISGDGDASASQPAGRPPSQTDVQGLRPRAEDQTSSDAEPEIIPVSVQETSQST